MKAKITFIFITAILLFSFRIYNESETRETSSLPHPDSSFIIGVLESGAEWRYHILVDSLGSNLWHRYPHPDNGWITHHNNWQPFDFIDAEYQDYHTGVENIIRTNRDSGMFTLMNRGKIQRLCFGQRSDYQCEKVSMVNPDYWFYTYKNREGTTDKTGRDTIDNSQFGNGASVVYCKQNTDSAGYVVKGLKTNREQINAFGEWGMKAIDSRYKWHIKPRIRVDTNVVQQSDTTRICRIEISNFYGNTIKNITLRSRNFKNIFNPYNGKYLEEYFYESNDTQLIVDPTFQELFNPNSKNLYDTTCMVDFRVYWYGQCDMWIDYVRVDNEVANDLFKGVYDSTWLQWEAKDIASQFPNGVYRFYIEEFEFNQIPCMSYVNRKIDSLWKVNNPSGSMSLMCNLNYSTFKIHIPQFETVRPTAEYIKRTLIDKVGSKEIFIGAYPFNKDGEFGLNSYIPNTLDSSSYSVPTRLGVPVSVNTYEDWLQPHLDNDRNQFFDLTLYFKLAQGISKASDILLYI